MSPWVERELARFDRVAVPNGDGSGWYDPTADDLARRVVELARRTRRNSDGALLPRRTPPGWTRAGWRARLLQLADACAALHPDKARRYRAVADGREKLSP